MDAKVARTACATEDEAATTSAVGSDSTYGNAVIATMFAVAARSSSDEAAASPSPAAGASKDQSSGAISSTCSTDGSLSGSRSSQDLHQLDDSCGGWQRDSTPSPRQCYDAAPQPMLVPHLLPPPPSWFIVSYLGGIEIRTEPRFDAPRTGVILKQNDVLAIVEEVDGGDSRTYLRLADGRGWIFEDSQLMPQDPSVVRGCWFPQPLPPPITATTLATNVDVGPLSCPPPPPLSPPPYAKARKSPCVLATNAPRMPISRFRVTYLGGINIRTAPSVEAVATGTTLRKGEVFHVTEEVQGADGRLYLKLADLPGWAFDDSALEPNDPSAVREAPFEPSTSDCCSSPGARGHVTFDAAATTVAAPTNTTDVPAVAQTFALLSTSPAPALSFDPPPQPQEPATAAAAMEDTWEWDDADVWTRSGGDRGRRSKRSYGTSSRHHQSRRKYQ